MAARFDLVLLADDVVELLGVAGGHLVLLAQAATERQQGELCVQGEIFDHVRLDRLSHLAGDDAHVIGNYLAAAGPLRLLC